MGAQTGAGPLPRAGTGFAVPAPIATLPLPMQIWVSGCLRCTSILLGAAALFVLTIWPKTAKAEPSYAAPALAAPAAPALVRYEDSRLKIQTADGRFSINLQHRLQFRYAHPFDLDPRSFADLDETASSFFVRRARLRLDGHAFWPWLEWRLQYDWAQPVLRDFSFTINKVPWLRVVLGQRKVFWNDERVVSSGQQQFVNRSIVNDMFTIDRQQGIQILGRLFPGRWADVTYHAGVFTGRGVGERYNDDAHMMYAGRLQWNMLGGEMDYSQSDIASHERPAASLALGAATNVSGCTAYETDQESCRALPTPRSDGAAFADPEDAAGRYKLEQGFAEFRLKWAGIYAKHESHLKRVIDRSVDTGAPGRTTVMRGALTQLGYFPHHMLAFVPKPLELAARYAFVDPARTVAKNLQTEASGVINWFFAGHNNKVSVEVSRLTVADPLALATRATIRFRLQWDVSF